MSSFFHRGSSYSSMRGFDTPKEKVLFQKQGVLAMGSVCQHILIVGNLLVNIGLYANLS